MAYINWMQEHQSMTVSLNVPDLQARLEQFGPIGETLTGLQLATVADAFDLIKELTATPITLHIRTLKPRRVALCIESLKCFNYHELG